jgi:Flp pilus assembly protein TadD
MSTANLGDDVPLAEALPLAELIDPRFEEAAALLERAQQAGCHDPQAAYLLGLAYKRQGKCNEARAAFRKIQTPDAGVILQLALLSLQEGNLTQAADELGRAWQMDATSFAIGYNLLLTHLSLERFDQAATLLPALFPLAPMPERARLLELVQAVLPVPEASTATLVQMQSAEEQLLLRFLHELGRIDAVLSMLRRLAEARPQPRVREAYFEAVLLKARFHVDRCAWLEAEALLRPWLRQDDLSRPHQTALLNLLGCCAAMLQDFSEAVGRFEAALKLAGNDPRLHQNLAIAFELQNDHAQADQHWTRFLELLVAGSRARAVAAPPGIPDYATNLEFETLCRLGFEHRNSERWPNALNYLQRAHRLHPADSDVLEALFQVYLQTRRRDDAGRVLDKLRAQRPDDAQVELYELDLIEIKSLEDIECALGRLERLQSDFPADRRVEDRALHTVGTVLPLMGAVCEQLSDQLAKVVNQVRALPSFEIHWAAVNDVMRDLHREFQKLRRITNKCLNLVVSDEQRRIVRQLGEAIDRKIDTCRSMMG